MKHNFDHFLNNLLDIHWLRPETALWRTFDCLMMEKFGEIRGYSIDLGCGDGTMSYIMAGGRTANYDAFQDVAGLDHYNAGSDIHNVMPTTGITVDDSHLRFIFSEALDHKAGLIEKARRFKNFYKNARVHDLNIKLPFDDKTVDSAFSNILYWLSDVEAVISDWSRVMKSGAVLNLFVPSRNFQDMSWIYYRAPHSGDNKYLNFFDRGYADLIKHCYDSEEWASMFRAAGFQVRHHERYLSRPVMDIWNIGTRPIAPLLIKTADRLSASDRAEIKQEWVSYFHSFFLPIIEGEFGRPLTESQAGFHFFVLEKTKA